MDEIWVGDSRAEDLPVSVAPGEIVALAVGDMLIAVRPLTRTDLGCDAPMRLAAIEDDLVLEMYNYLGPEKIFWDSERRSRFFRGEPQCGFSTRKSPSVRTTRASGPSRVRLPPAC